MELVVRLLRADRRRLKTSVTEAEGSITPISATSRTALATTVKKTGHIAKVCRSKRGSKSEAHAEQDFKSSQRTHHVHSKGEEELYDGQLFNMPCKAPSPFMFTVQINQAKLQMEVDKGASASVISYDTFALLWPKSQRPQLRPSNRKLHT